ncbi:MAG: extracellular solute-binding protein [Gammaproteobacteria bacterium]|nr:extracellular solute-binding protein [Gammaproteobacteria bacterium]MDH5305077.1 extracellular solute-binding protein [Gammaproteobacteria bacterium]MDH5322923.1 extracellular solute-binding protein [Gammaproteobacteria bacterium]
MRITITIAGLVALLLAACSGGDRAAGADSKIVNVYNWADYLAPDTIARFEAEYGIKVNYDLYDSSEVVDVKLLAGNTGYDVVFHSYSYASKLAPVGLFEVLDRSRLSNLGNLDPKIMELFDSFEAVRDLAVPYHWGSTGYAWNYDMIRERLPDHAMDSADVLFDPEIVAKLADCGVSLLDGASDVISHILAYHGRDPAAVDEESLQFAEQRLREIKPYIRYFSNEKVLSDMPNKEVCVAMSWSGDYAQAAARAVEAGIEIDLRYTAPKEGTRLWVDGMFMPSDARNKDNAYLFMDFMLRADIAADIANVVNYANANRASWQFIEPQVLEDPAVFPDPKTMDSLFVVYPADPIPERARTRAYARAKSGI